MASASLLCKTGMYMLGVGIINFIALNAMDRIFSPRLFIIIYVWLISLANPFPTKKVLPKPQVSHKLHYIISHRKKSYNRNKMAKKGHPDLSKKMFNTFEIECIQHETVTDIKRYYEAN